MGHRPRRTAGSLGVAVVVLAAGAAVAYGVAATRPGPRTHAPPHHVVRDSTTTTTPPSAYAPVATAASSATYAPVTASYSLSVGATTGACWVSVTLQDGTTVLARTFAPGSSSVVPLAGGATIVLGAPTEASLAVDGVPLQLPPGMVGPFTVTLTPK